MRKSGINSSTPNDFLLGAGVVFKNFKYLYKKAERSFPLLLWKPDMCQKKMIM